DHLQNERGFARKGNDLLPASQPGALQDLEKRERHAFSLQRLSTVLLMEIISRLLTEASSAKQVRAYWETAARLLSEQAGGLGSFLIELSRWLLATPDRDLLLRYTMQSLMSLVGAEGSYVALREPHQEELRVVIALGLAEDKKGMTLPLASSTTGSVVHSGQP